MSQPSSRQCSAPLSGEGDSARTPAEPQNSQHESDLQTSSLELDETEISPEIDGSSTGDGNEQSVSFPRLRISKIYINKKDKDKTAEEIISNITLQTPRRGTEGPINPHVPASDVQIESVLPEGVPNTNESQSTDGDNNEHGAMQQSVLDPAKAVLKATVKELTLKKCVTDRLAEHESGFHVKLFECTTPIHSQILPAIESIIEPRHFQHVNQRIGHLIFFYRDTDGPEIFVAVSGTVYLHVDQKSCPEFPKKMARRLLEPTTIQLDMRNVTGDTSQVRKQYIPDRGGTINIWDVIDVVVHKYIAKPKKTSSILEFCDTWKTKRPSIAVKQLCVEVMTRFPNIYIMQKIISHFAKIDRNEPTYQLDSSQTVEEDDETFTMFELMQEERHRDTIAILQENLYRRINRCLKNKSEDNIQLSCDDLNLWLKVSEYRLFLDTKSKRSPIRTWKESQPNFRDVIQALRNHVSSNEISGKMLHTDVKMSLRIADGKLCTKKPITSFIQSNFASSPSKPYYFWCGKWLKIKLEYFQVLDDNFNSVMEEQTISSAYVMPLPWVYSQAGEASVELTTKRFSLDSLREFLTYFSNKEVVVDLKETKQLLRSVGEVGEVDDVEGSIVCSYETRDYEDPLKLCLQIFLRMCTPLTEGMYNDTYILLDKLMSLTVTPLQTGLIVGDRMLINNIEMFDIIMYNQTHTYIIHVKEGFENNTRVVASQIRNSADILFRALTSHMTKTILDEMWDRFTGEKTQKAGRKSQPTLVELEKKKGMEKNQRAMKSKLSEMTKEGFMRLFKEREIVYVLAARDKSEVRTMETASAMVTQLQKDHPSRYQKILQRLEVKTYVQKKRTDHVVTEKFRYTNQKNFLKDMMKDSLDECNLSDEKGNIHSSDGMNSKAASSAELQSSTDNLTRGFDKERPYSSSSAGSPQKNLTVTEAAYPIPSTRHETQGLGQDLWKKVYAILRAQLPDTRSSIVKLDLLSLFSHFRKYQIGERKFQLRVCFIPKSKKDMVEDLRTFLGLK
ncbi:uncharacterized protein [Haliotis asinina]|uniref:uncharacterized protein n=1 Tax=Haliotis asinina TaxID=109174 RepID=UPI00353223F7